MPSNAGVADSVPGRGAKIPHALGPKNQNVKHKHYCNNFSKDFQSGPHQKTQKTLKPKKGDLYWHETISEICC